MGDQVSVWLEQAINQMALFKNALTFLGANLCLVPGSGHGEIINIPIINYWFKKQQILFWKTADASRGVSKGSYELIPINFQ